jgi:hypothetical protein
MSRISITHVELADLNESDVDREVDEIFVKVGNDRYALSRKIEWTIVCYYSNVTHTTYYQNKSLQETLDRLREIIS